MHHRSWRRRRSELAGLALGLSLVLGACSGTSSSVAGKEPSGLALAPGTARVDLAKPKFSDPTRVDNPLFPVKGLHSVVLLGNLDGRAFRTETTLLPGTKTIRLDGRPVEALVSQYVAWIDGRIDEVALDWYAQADDGSVWYLGEDVFNYEDGAIANREGTWLAGKDGPAAMIMPAAPRFGDAFRPENAFPIVFEEVTVNAVERTVKGPRGDVPGAIVTRELHMDGTTEEKIFAPGYGEFSTGSGGDLEALAVAVPTDAVAVPAPAEVETVLRGALDVYAAAGSGDWRRATATLGAMRSAWATFEGRGGVPPLLDAQMDRALAALDGDALAPAVGAGNPHGAQKRAIGVARAALDLQLRHRKVSAIDADRFVLWTRQLQVDVATAQSGDVAGDVTILEWVRDRFAHAVGQSEVKELDALLGTLRAAADDEDLPAAGTLADRLAELASRIARSVQLSGA